MRISPKLVLRFLRVFAILCLLAPFASLSARAHVIPRSDLELHLDGQTLSGHIDAPKQGLAWEMPGLETLPEAEQNGRIGQFLSGRLHVKSGETTLHAVPQSVAKLPDGKRVRLGITFDGNASGKISIGGNLFPTDPSHKTFVSLYKGEALVCEAVSSRDTPPVTYTPGQTQSTGEVIRQFVREGIHHIFIGPDHILFIAGLMLLGGSLKKLLKIVTAFTLAHSITLVLATLSILNPSPRLIEPLIALSIVFVGVHTLWAQQQKKHKDLRVVFAAGFGLIHGFGFASVLREMDLPRAALGWSLFSFNVGVEIGQMCIVLAVAPLLVLLCQKKPESR